ncbi:hypothetical protein [Candidatus Tisiphia endosymbiont of Nedyus quadrimaculatus]|uniref:hypothetical protein n=1 Tax=Candidatus Tisiphia endosymbiont of Nedyus quadrimaculatus TaxID=3139332 RepID=UPI00345ED06A
MQDNIEKTFNIIIINLAIAFSLVQVSFLINLEKRSLSKQQLYQELSKQSNEAQDNFVEQLDAQVSRQLTNLKN